MNTSLVTLVPALNEEARIGKVLDVLCDMFPFGRTVVIDGGSIDQTTEIAKKYPVELLSFDKSLGKGAALQAGINHAKQSDYWLFIDADLINLRPLHLIELLLPLHNDPHLAMTVGKFKGGRSLTDIAHHCFSILNGQRGLAGWFVEKLPDLSWSHFGVEIFLSKFAQNQGYSIAHPYLPELTHHTKEAKFGFIRGFPYRLKMYGECLYSIFTWKSKIDSACNKELESMENIDIVLDVENYNVFSEVSTDTNQP